MKLLTKQSIALFAATLIISSASFAKEVSLLKCILRPNS